MTPKTTLKHLAAGYFGLVLAPLIVLLIVLRWGSELKAPADLDAISNAPSKVLPSAPDLFLLVLQICLILLVSRVVGTLFRFVGQPRVIGEMAAGIILGPSLLGWIAPGLWSAIFPAPSLGFLNALSQVGLVLFMFIVGLEVSPSELKALGRSALIVSHASITVPFVLGVTLALFLYPRFSTGRVSFLNFSLFLGAAMSITAFPVLARILTERKLLNTTLGLMAIACAAVNDVTGWCVLAAILVPIRAQTAAPTLWITAGGTVAFAFFVIYVLRPLLRGFEQSFQRRGTLDDDKIALLILLVLGSALVTERLGIHLLFGAFLLGAVMPKNQELVAHISGKFESVTVVVLLPLFFAFSGLRTNIGLLHGAEMWFYCGLIVMIAICGKLGGSAIAARASGINWREAAGIGVLMNTRGLMELVILNIGLDIHVISPTLFSMMVIMALTTTFMTTPLLELVCPSAWLDIRRTTASPVRLSA
jgi:Kef-type K+ transport system membrane component KefB